MEGHATDPQTLPLRQPGRPDVPEGGWAKVLGWAEELALCGSQRSSERQNEAAQSIWVGSSQGQTETYCSPL